VKPKVCTPLLAALGPIVLFTFIGMARSSVPANSIERLTYSGNGAPLFPCLSLDGSTVVYVLEADDDGTATKSVRILNIDTGDERELYRSGEKNAPPPFENRTLLVGTKPPQISRNGQTAAISLSLGGPAGIPDHYLAVIETDGSDFQIFSFPIAALEGKKLKSIDISSRDWERVANYALDSEGKRLACVVKGHLGPSRQGNPSAIIAIDLTTKEQRTLLAPVFENEAWNWPSAPKNPLTGGGWSFGFSGNGEILVFGAQSSDDRTDYDLYALKWDGGEPVQLTDFSDRWFSVADISTDGKRIVFYYAGQKKQGIGTYVLNRGEGDALSPLTSGTSPRIDFYAFSGDGLRLIFKQVYTGMELELSTGITRIAFDENTPGYAYGSAPMDFPRLPSFWSPQIMSASGDRILLVGFPDGKMTPELFLLQMSQ